MDTEIRKFQSLELNQKYRVQNYTKTYDSKYGEYRILLVSEEKSDETFKLYTTPLLLKYIDTNKIPHEGFSFIVKEKKGNKYPLIEGYEQEINWIL